MINTLERPPVKARCVVCMNDTMPGYDFLIHIGVVHLCRKCSAQLTKGFLDYLKGTD